MDKESKPVKRYDVDKMAEELKKEEATKVRKPSAAQARTNNHRRSVHHKLDQLQERYDLVEGKVDSILSHVIKTRVTTLIVGTLLILGMVGLFAILF